jgi:hypothetical protein
MTDFGMKYLVLKAKLHVEERPGGIFWYAPLPVEFSHEPGLKTTTSLFEAEIQDLEAWTLIFSDSVSFFFPAP